ncbi:hypothetical protein ACKQTC_02600 [Peptococcus simiae]|uniref:Uncharacterized protein n=1 Tax=Peptococcus simiae TaxID=1643805 RepID=A0ABW9GYL5_9FIRM
MKLDSVSNPKGQGASTPQDPRKEDPFIDNTIPPDSPAVNGKNNESGQYAISPHLETPIERGNRLAREMGLKESGLKALRLDPLGRERVGSYRKYGPEMKGFSDGDHLLGRLGNARSSLYARLVDDASPLVRLSKALPEEYKNGELDRVMIEDRLQQVRQAGGTIDYIAEKALLDANGQVIGESWADMDALVPKKLRGEFNAYRQALHQLDRLQEGKDVTSDTMERAAWKVANIEKAHPAFVDIVDKQNAWWRSFMQAWAVDTGLISQDTFNQWQEMYPNYFPTYRTNKKGGGSGIKLTDAGDFKKAKGSHEEVADYSDNMMRKVAEIVVAERKNELHGDLVKALSLGDYDMRGWGRVLDKGNMEEARVEDGFELFPESTEAGKEQTEKGKNEFIYRVGGEAVPFVVNNDLAYGLNSLRAKDFGQLAYPLKLMRTAVGGMKMVTTGANPYFAINNGIRDIQAGFVHSSANARYPKEYAQAMTSIISNGDMWNEYRQMGGSASGFYSDTRDMVRAYSKRKGKGAKVLDALGAFNEVIEQTPRLLEYTRVRNEEDLL